MKSLQRPSFFRMFDLLLSTTNPGFKLSRWTHDGVEFERERHSFSSPRHGLTIEIVTLTRSGRRAWPLMVTKEYWWAGTESKAFKNPPWACKTNRANALGASVARRCGNNDEGNEFPPIRLSRNPVAVRMFDEGDG